MLAERVFSTEGAPEARRGHLMQRQMADMFSMGLTYRPGLSQPLRAKMTAYPGSRLMFAELSFSPHVTTAVPGASRPGSSTRSERMLISLHRTGYSRVSQDGRQSEIGPGDFFLLDPSRPFEINSGEVVARSIYPLMAPLRGLVPNIGAYTAIGISGDVGPGALLRALLDETSRMTSSMSESIADAIADAVPAVVAAAISSVALAEGDPPGSRKAVILHRIRRFALDHLSDPDLSVETVAAGVNLSRRYIHGLFQDEPTTLMRWLWETRLERCRRDLALPSMRGRSITEIAYSWGFNDPAHFSRTFKQAFSCSPRDYRIRMSQRVVGF